MNKLLSILALFGLMFLFADCNAQEQKTMDNQSFQVIRKMTLAHCARGPEICEKCHEMAKQHKYCLLEVFKGHGMIARPVTSVEFEGQTVYLEYDVLKIFESKKEALRYAEENKLAIIKPE